MGFVCLEECKITEFVWEFNRGFVKQQPAVSTAVRLRVSKERASTVYQSELHPQFPCFNTFV